MSGRPSPSPPTTTTFEFGDFASSSVASIPLSLKILSVSDALRILLASALACASMRIRIVKTVAPLPISFRWLS